MGVIKQGTALVRRPGPRLAEGIVTHIERQPVDLDLAMEQHAGYVAALRANGWEIHEVTPAPDSPDAVFIEDVLVVHGELAIVTRPGAPQRRAEVAGAQAAAAELGLRVAAISEPGSLDGGDVLQVAGTVYIGRGGRTNGEGIRQVRSLTGARVVPVPISKVLHLKSAATALPDGTFLALPDAVPAGLFPGVREVDEEAGCHVVPIGGDRILISASAPRTADFLADLGFQPIIVEIGEFEKLEGCVTCLSVLIPTGGAQRS
jgi:dimethylargininase